MTENKVSLYYCVGDLVKATFVFDASYFGIIFKKTKRTSGFGKNKSLVTQYHLITTRGIIVINDFDWEIEKV